MSWLIGVGMPTVSLLPVLIFVAETCVVTLSTIRTIFIARGLKVPASVLGFFEVSTWLFAIGQIMKNLSSLDCYIAFAAGFSLGNFLGVFIERKLAVGNVVVNVTTTKDPGGLTETLRGAGFGVITHDARGSTGPVRVVVTVIRRKALKQVTAIIHGFDPRAFYSVHDLQAAARGVVPEVGQVLASPVALWKSSQKIRRRPTRSCSDHAAMPLTPIAR